MHFAGQRLWTAFGAAGNLLITVDGNASESSEH